jgi:antitoxin VapB
MPSKPLKPVPAVKEPRKVRLFRNNRSQAVRIPAEFELPGDTVLISQEGDRLIIEPAPRSRGLIALLDEWEPIGDVFPDVDADLPPLRNIEL